MFFLLQREACEAVSHERSVRKYRIRDQNLTKLQPALQQRCVGGRKADEDRGCRLEEAHILTHKLWQRKT